MLNNLSNIVAVEKADLSRYDMRQIHQKQESTLKIITNTRDLIWNEKYKSSQVFRMRMNLDQEQRRITRITVKYFVKKKQLRLWHI